MASKLPRKLEMKMQAVGGQIRLARLRRNLSVVPAAERATCSPMTIARIEKGAPSVSIGVYLRVLYALQLDDDILLLAQKDEMGRALQDLALKHRERASKKVSSMRILLYADFDMHETPLLVGELGHESLRGSDSYSFKYDNEWLSQYGGLFLCADVNNYPDQQYAQPNRDIFDCFCDALPNRWGNFSSANFRPSIT